MPITIAEIIRAPPAFTTTEMAYKVEQSRNRSRPPLWAQKRGQAVVRKALREFQTGGNLDCKKLLAGSVLYVPSEVDGALGLLGDGHTAQGDREARHQLSV